jgi:ribosomal protein S14
MEITGNREPMNPNRQQSQCEECPYPKGYPCELCGTDDFQTPDALIDHKK